MSASYVSPALSIDEVMDIVFLDPNATATEKWFCDFFSQEENRVEGLQEKIYHLTCEIEQLNDDLAENEETFAALEDEIHDLRKETQP